MSAPICRGEPLQATIGRWTTSDRRRDPALRHRRRWRQVDLAQRAGRSPLAHRSGRARRALGTIPLGKLRRVAGLSMRRFDTILRWQGADLDRLLDARHAAMHDAMAGLLGSLDGWQFEPEVSFSIFGERGDHRYPGVASGSADAARHRAQDRDRRHRPPARTDGPAPAAGAGHRAAARVDAGGGEHLGGRGRGRTNRRTLATYVGVLRAKFPADGRRMRGWLRDPVDRIDALGFLPDRHACGLGRPVARPGGSGQVPAASPVRDRPVVRGPLAELAGVERCLSLTW